MENMDNFELAKRIVETCTARKIFIATAESCTGGLVAAAITEVPGSSAVFDRGFVCYSDDAKTEILGLYPITLKQHGAVSRETAMEMAHGALARSDAGLAVAVTGIAGPDGGTPAKPVGLVHIAAKHYNGTMIHRDMQYGDLGRSGIRAAAVRTALEMLWKLANMDPTHKG
jgi:nicotinamide-nucleotide amidase